MALVWMLKGKKAGQFVPVTEDEAAALIESGEAQSSLTPPHLVRVPEYTTREIRSDQKAKRRKKVTTSVAN